jgi:hypothetical protein
MTASVSRNSNEPLQQPPLFELRTWSMINIEQIQHLLIQFLTSDKWWPPWQIGTKKTAKQWWALQQPPLCECRTRIMINMNQLNHVTHCWYPQMCLSNQFDSIPHQWQMMASGSNARGKQQQNSGGHYSNCLFVNSGHGLWSIQTSFTIWHTAGTHTCASWSL